MKNEALLIAEEGLREFPDDCSEIYMSLGDAYFEMGWLEEARGILTEGLRKFPGDEVIENLLGEIEIIEHYWYKYVCRKEVIGPIGNIETR